jgi:hypothetical protein
LRPRTAASVSIHFAFGADGTFAVQAQAVAERNWDSENFLVNLGDPVRLVPDRWYCIEVFVKLNAARSQRRAGRRMGRRRSRSCFYDGRQFRGAGALDPSPAGSGLDSTSVAGSYGGLTTVPSLQFSWHDDYVASTGRVGCGAYPPLRLPSIVR